MLLLVLICGFIGFELIKVGFGPAMFGASGIMRVGLFLFCLMIGWFLGGFMFGF